MTGFTQFASSNNTNADAQAHVHCWWQDKKKPAESARPPPYFSVQVTTKVEKSLDTSPNKPRLL